MASSEMVSISTLPSRTSLGEAAQRTLLAGFRPLHWLISQPALVFLLTLAVMLFRPPDLQFYALDRVAFAVLIFVVVARAFLLDQPLLVAGPVTWPMLGLLLLSLAGVLGQPFETENWSLLAARWVVPFALYHLAGLVFDDAASLRRLEAFALVVLAYLSFIAIAFLVGLRQLVVPQFILDVSLGNHADRARGPFLQAVANGVTLNLLGLIALDAFRRYRLRGLLALLFLTALPFAILATNTRAVWLSFAGSILLMLLASPSQRMRRACMSLVVIGAAGLLIAFALGDASALRDRMEETSPVDYRVSVYESGWNMFLEKPLFGWQASQIQNELLRRTSGFHVEAFYFHNTYLEITVEHGLLGLGLYLWLVIDLFRIARAPPGLADDHFPDAQFRPLWRVMVVVYLINASFVGMNYQFVNGLLFTIAGILAAQNRRAQLQSDASSS